jgi:hypothetical protein
MKTVGLREFRMSMADYITSGEKIVITNNGKEIGIFIPKYKVVPNEEYPKEDH